MTEAEISVKDLLNVEKEFLQLAMPSHSHSSEEVLGTNCCSNHCVLYTRRLDILLARLHYWNFYKNLGKEFKRDARYIFLSTLKRVGEDNLRMISVNQEFSTCPTLFARTFGISLNVLMNSFGDVSLSHYRNREWYAKSVSTIAEALKTLSSQVQFNSLNQIMVSPATSSQLPMKGARTIPVSEIRRKMDVQIRQRKNDSLVRCSVCFGLRTIMAKATTEEERKEAKRKLDLHFEYISQQKVIIQTMCLQSRDDRFDLSVFLIDGMSNRHTKLPNLGDRPKFVTDSIRVIVCLTTVQVAISQGPYEFTNFDYPSIQSVFSHDSSYVLSLFLDGLSKLKSIPSVITVILDSAPNNKSYVMLGGMGAILARISAIRKIFLLYPSTGHTHMSVDGHFGSLSKSLGSRDLLDPQDFVNFLESCPSVAEVNVAPTIYDFVPVQQHMVKVPNLFSNSQICVSKGDGGKVYWSAASSLHSSILFKTESDENAFPLFKEDFNPTTFSATIRKPEIEPIVKKIDGLFKNSGNLYSEAQKHNFSTFVETYGKKAFRHSITDLNRKQSKLTQPSHPSQVQDPHITVLQYLEKNKYPTGKVPKTPLV